VVEMGEDKLARLIQDRIGGGESKWNLKRKDNMVIEERRCGRYLNILYL
jgi:hypothetical protein